MTIAKPTQVATPFANSGLKNSIPQSATGSNLASLEEGFPAVTMAAVADGGTPPQGQDFNGILNQVTNQLRYAQAGGLYPYDSTFCTAIGGYPLGAILMSADGSKVWQNQVSGNTNNPDSDSTNWTELCTVDALTAGLATKQGTLTFDSTPTANSSNPVTSDGIKTALDGKLSLTGGEMTGAILSSANVGVEVSRDSESTWGCSAIRTDTGNNIAFGIGGSGDNRGIFDNSLNNWLINRNSIGTLQSGGADVILSTGGMMTGTLKFNKSNVFILDKDDKAILGHDTNNNQMYLSSPDGNKYLRLGDDGDAKWRGYSLEASKWNNFPTTWDGFMRYLTGLQVCFGGVNSGSNAVAVTFPAPFRSAPIILVSRSAGDSTTTAAGQPFTRKQTATGFEIYFPATTNARWFAIGWAPD